MTEPQVWVLVGIFGTALFTLMGLMWSFSTRLVRSEVGRVEGILLVKFDSIDRRLDGMDQKIAGLDGDVRMLIRRVTGIDPE